MGLLDDAIREHLELKRRHGADPSEVARQEQEALGPPRRGTAAEEVELAEDELAPDADLYDHDEDLVEDELADEEPYAEDDLPPEDDRGPLSDPDAQAGAISSVDQPTQAFEVEGADADPPPEEDDGRGEDVLEETPEFLQETPEHDRLWFEQKPPRDFDF